MGVDYGWEKFFSSIRCAVTSTELLQRRLQVVVSLCCNTAPRQANTHVCGLDSRAVAEEEISRSHRLASVILNTPFDSLLTSLIRPFSDSTACSAFSCVKRGGFARDTDSPADVVIHSSRSFAHFT